VEYDDRGLNYNTFYSCNLNCAIVICQCKPLLQRANICDHISMLAKDNFTFMLVNVVPKWLAVTNYFETEKKFIVHAHV
jgi:hypothetical protein